MSKNIVETEGPQMTSQYDAYALRDELARLYARMSMHTLTHLGSQMHARTHEHAYTHRPVSNTYYFSRVTMIRDRASVLRFMYIFWIVFCKCNI
jgi:hypothetical protein